MMETSVDVSILESLAEMPGFFITGIGVL